MNIENYSDFDREEARLEAESALPQLCQCGELLQDCDCQITPKTPILTEDQIAKLVNDPSIKATIEANKEAVARQRDCDLMMLGYNQALHGCGNWPEGHTAQSWNKVIECQKAKLGIE